MKPLVRSTIPADSRRRRAGGNPIGVILGLLALAIVVTTALWWFSGTKTFQGFILDYLQNRTDCEWTLERSRLQWPGDLVCSGIAMRGEQGGRQGTVLIGTARIGWRWGNALAVELLAPAVELVRQSDNRWKPEFLGKLGALRAIDEVADLFLRLRPGLLLTVRNGHVRWLDGASGATLADIEGLELTSQPLNVPARPMRHYRLGARRVQRPDGGRGQNIEREWISSPTRKYLELDYRGLWLDEEQQPDIWSPVAGDSRR
jgi:hypothetical protein